MLFYQSKHALVCTTQGGELTQYKPAKFMWYFFREASQKELSSGGNQRVSQDSELWLSRNLRQSLKFCLIQWPMATADKESDLPQTQKTLHAF